MANNISQRDAFWNKVYELAKVDKDIVIITADMGAPALDKIREDISSQFVNVGIAEQNAITIAAGLSLTGKRGFYLCDCPFYNSTMSRTDKSWKCHYEDTYNYRWCWGWFWL